MYQHKIRHLPVLDDGDLVEVISLRDFLNLFIYLFD
ncbi:hypothetical protein M1545_03655 [Patescibacteria group bacterium]|nr:hypothetical protein [Patescibacteria group bacterium]